ncbi:formimidoylglutamate deiminase [Rhizobium sp. KVB221]|uniref:Formimidoylglutamate deiminase n=1 Tax=Rhizobium setariae TaxID=2801340 RepID=A0A937CM83_9HYPH|nr:formimidoylglutamate deiminase [Rhizobium setariae]MBL0372471.1 formimidoylglutamate deiminase [Rhizobium setariae]
MAVVFAERALGPSGWLDNVRMTASEGRFTAIEANQQPVAGDEIHKLIVPGMANLHSHAFQRAMAGLAETRGPGDDSFWSWRNIMYRFALSMAPEQVEAVASQLYMEMLEAGFTRVGEFHYLHHDKSGEPYADLAEMAARVAAASAQTGIGLTLLPVYYANSGFGGAEPAEGQRRFINTPDRYARLLEACRAIVGRTDGANLGIAPHSLRAVTPDSLRAVLPLMPDGPIHIHISEQVKEVEDCIAWSGRRPVEWLLENFDVDARWCLIHATHMTDDETRAMAQSGAVAGLCPITEANLGDGTFPAAAFMDAGGAWGIGSDSNILIGIADELRQLEYSQRLAHRARNVIAQPNGSTGRRLFDAAVSGGAQAMGASSGLQVGNSADFASLRPKHVEFTDDRLLDRFIFAQGADIDCVWVRGVKQVRDGRHVAREQVSARFGNVMRELVAGL